MKPPAKKMPQRDEKIFGLRDGGTLFAVEAFALVVGEVFALAPALAAALARLFSDIEEFGD
jgi:hypothetical protein